MIKKPVYTDLRNEEDVNNTINMADYYFFKNAFNDKELESIKKVAMEFPAVEAATGQELAERKEDSVRKSTVRWMTGGKGQEDWIYKRIFDMVNEANNHLWNFNLSHAAESLQYTEYPPDGGHYDWHIDCGNHIQAQRKVSVTVQLNDDYEGGELELWRGQKPVTALKEKGCVVVFPSYMLHRVKPVTSGTRNSLVLWLGGDHYR